MWSCILHICTRVSCALLCIRARNTETEPNRRSETERERETGVRLLSYQIMTINIASGRRCCCNCCCRTILTVIRCAHRKASSRLLGSSGLQVSVWFCWRVPGNDARRCTPKRRSWFLAVCVCGLDKAVRTKRECFRRIYSVVLWSGNEIIFYFTSWRIVKLSKFRCGGAL